MWAGWFEFCSPGVTMGKGNPTRFVCFKDPDGTVLELIDFGAKR